MSEKGVETGIWGLMERENGEVVERCQENGVSYDLAIVCE